MASIIAPASLSNSRTVVRFAMLVATISMILSGCAVPAAVQDSAIPPMPQTQTQLPTDWPDAVLPPGGGFTLEYAVGGTDDGRTDFTAQFAAFGDATDAINEYIATLLDAGFGLVEQRSDLGIWVLKGFGLRVEVILDGSHANLTWLAVFVATR
jgi:hypothetical protein